MVAFTGAGVSTESGIPDFRSKGGLWSRFDPDEFRFERFLADPTRFWAMRGELMRALALDRAQPNAAHVALARAERSSRFLGTITQNIDGLHARAGSKRVVEVHGSALRVRCVECLRFFPFDAARAALDRGEVPRCDACGGVVKPGTVLFGEPMPADDLARAESWARACDALLVVGTSLEVWPAAGLVPLACARGARVVLVNRDATPLDAEADHVLRGSAGDLLPDLLARAGLA